MSSALPVDARPRCPAVLPAAVAQVISDCIPRPATPRNLDAPAVAGGATKALTQGTAAVITAAITATLQILRLLRLRLLPLRTLGSLAVLPASQTS